MYLTDDCVRVKFSDLVEKCFVLPEESINDLQTWLNASTLHFFVAMKSSHLHDATLQSLSRLSSRDMVLCQECMSNKEKEMGELQQFRGGYALLRTFDPFAGVGALVRGSENSGVAKFTHGIEICPSTAKTLRFITIDYLAF